VASLNSSNGNPVTNFQVQTSSPLLVRGLGCSYSSTKTVTPTACGVMCGGGIGYITTNTDVWNLNISISSADYKTGHNLTVTSENGFGLLFLPFTQIFLNGQQTTAWYSNPPCMGGNGVEGDCLLSTATAVSIELPASFGNGQYQLTIYSSETLVP
jgi:hypothetical protein